ncbi:MAG: glycoside hydrolase [Acidisphaera sp.]|nr:glycoside hydrolase [Acidisphaera sp.]
MRRPTPLLIPLLAGLAAMLVLLWWWPNRPQAADVTMPDAKFNSISFAPYRAWQSPFAESFPSAAEVDADMALVAPRTRGIRSYAAAEGDYDTAALAQRHGLKLWQGIWLGQDPSKNAKEIAHGIALANRYPDVIERVVVGNEVLLRRDLPVEALTAAIDRVHAAVRQPVTYADVWEFWEQFPQVAAHVDVVTIHILPYWENHPTSIDGAIGHVREVVHRTALLFPGKPLAIGETGWPSRGRWRRDAAPGLVNEAVFLRRFVALARQEHFDYNLIEAFDEVWKYQSEGTVGANWGLWTAGRAQKLPLAGPVEENADWPLDAGLSVLLGLLLLVPALSVPGLDFVAQLRLGILAMVLGGALGFAWAGTAPVLYDLRLRIAGVGNLAGQATLAWLMMRRAALLLAGAPVAPPRSGAQATQTVQELLRLRLAVLRHWPDRLLDDLGFVFLWTAGLLQCLLVFDPRYRDFPLPSFAVPLAVILVRAGMRDLPLHGGGREEALAAGVLVVGAIASAVQEGPLNRQALIWNAAAVLLAAPALLRCLRRRVAAPA